MSNSNYDDIAFVVTSWEPNLFLSIKQTLLSFGVVDKNIIKISERVSRPKSLNKVWNDVSSEIIAESVNRYNYIAFIDEDVVIRDNHVFDRFKEILENPDNVNIAGVIANPKLFSEGQSLFEIQHDLAPTTPWQSSLSECTSNLISLNCALFRADLKQRFDEDLFGNQNFDVDFGLQLALDEKKVVIDKALLVLARANDYISKSLSYHSIVARNLHIFVKKWSNIKNWINVADYNAKNNNEIPSIEEITHLSEIKQMQYCFAYNRDGIARCYLGPRLGGLAQAGQFVQMIENSLKNVPNMVEYSIPYQGALPIFNNI